VEIDTLRKNMIEAEKVLEIILRALQNLNDELPDGDRFEVRFDTPLFGPSATLDSLALVSVIVDVEGDVSTAIGRSISLTDDTAMSQEISPFDNVQTLLNYIMILVKEG
jgi:acyl carrier protein